MSLYSSYINSDGNIYKVLDLLKDNVIPDDDELSSLRGYLRNNSWFIQDTFVYPLNTAMELLCQDKHFSQVVLQNTTYINSVLSNSLDLDFRREFIASVIESGNWEKINVSYLTIKEIFEHLNSKFLSSHYFKPSRYSSYFYFITDLISRFSKLSLNSVHYDYLLDLFPIFCNNFNTFKNTLESYFSLFNKEYIEKLYFITKKDSPILAYFLANPFINDTIKLSALKQFLFYKRINLRKIAVPLTYEILDELTTIQLYHFFDKILSDISPKTTKESLIIIDYPIDKLKQRLFPLFSKPRFYVNSVLDRYQLYLTIIERSESYFHSLADLFLNPLRSLPKILNYYLSLNSNYNPADIDFIFHCARLAGRHSTSEYQAKDLVEKIEALFKTDIFSLKKIALYEEEDD